jgi:putative membrane protein
MDQTPLLSLLNSAELQAFASGFPILLAHVGVTIVMLMLGATLYAILTPWREITLIRNGNSAAAVAFGGVLAGLAIPLAASLSASNSTVEIIVWGLATVLVQLLAFRLTDMVLAGLPDRIREGEVSAAVLLVSAKLAVALILAAAVTV